MKLLKLLKRDQAKNQMSGQENDADEIVDAEPDSDNKNVQVNFNISVFICHIESMERK